MPTEALPDETPETVTLHRATHASAANGKPKPGVTNRVASRKHTQVPVVHLAGTPEHLTKRFRLQQPQAPWKPLAGCGQDTNVSGAKALSTLCPA